MTQLPPVRLPDTVYGQQPAANELTDAVIEAAVDHAIERAKRHDTSPQAVVGNTPPVDQPGRPSMSPGATDASVMMIAGGFLSVCLGAAISGVLYFSHGANETVVITLCAAPPAAFLSLGALVKKVKKAAVPDVHNHHHNGPEYHETRTTNTRAVWSKTVNKQ